MTTKKYIELLAEDLELRKAQASRLGDLNDALYLMRRYRVPQDDPKVLKLKDKQRRINKMLKLADRLMSELEFYDQSEGDLGEGGYPWLDWWREQEDIEL